MRQHGLKPLEIQSLYDCYPLEQDEVRILVLHPSADQAARIECSFETANLSHDNLEYEAVSYTWGPPIEGWQLPDQTVRLCGLDATIKGNLADALRRFRYQDRERRLWVDALCINQANHGERAQQVALMARIYANAARTLVWVGEDSEAHDGAITIIACKAIHLDPPVAAFVSVVERRAWFRQPRAALDPILQLSLSGQGGDVGGSRSYDDLDYLIQPAAQTFIHRRYFTRRWILQEMFNAQSVEVHCGAHSIDGAAVTTGCKEMPIELQRPALVDPGMDLLQIGVYLESIETYSSPVLDLMWCAKYFGTSQCSDPRDRIYALLGFSGGSNIVNADYSIPPGQVWMNGGLALAREGYVGLLVTTAAEQFYQGYERDTGLPSWLPDFSAPTDLLPRDYPQGPVRVVDEHSQLEIVLRCFGEVRYHNGWAICTGMPEDMIGKASSLPPGPSDSRVSGPWEAPDWKVPVLRSIAHELRDGDLVCEVPDRTLRSFFVVVRPDGQLGGGEEIDGEIVGIASIRSDGERLSSSLQKVRLR
jgi:hypothetical protein